MDGLRQEVSWVKVCSGEPEKIHRVRDGAIASPNEVVLNCVMAAFRDLVP